jgi:hypothetical protein
MADTSGLPWFDDHELARTIETVERPGRAPKRE